MQEGIVYASPTPFFKKEREYPDEYTPKWLIIAYPPIQTIQLLARVHIQAFNMSMKG